MLRTTVLALFALLALTAAGASAKTSAASAGRMFQLPALQYNVSALEPVVNTQTMTFHHGSHHAAYVRNLNAALNGSFSGTDDLSRLLLKVGKRVWPSAQETAIRNQGGGHWNHAMFWKVMAAPNSSVNMESAISPALRAAIDATFGNLTNMQAEFNAAANTRFGSGWAWLCVQRPYAKRQLRIVSTANQDNPIMPVVSPKWPCVPILGNDVWEHAYYLRWGPARAGYVTAWWSIVNWQQVSANYEAAMARKIGYAAIAVDY